MTNQTSKTNSTIIPQTPDAQSARPIYINVKEAAKRLGVSKSKLYRMDRVRGPFRFLSAARPITIDLTSFESYLVNIAGIDAEADLLGADHPLTCQQEETPQQIDFPKPLIETEKSDTAPTREQASPVTNGRRREGMIPRPVRPVFIAYWS